MKNSKNHRTSSLGLSAYIVTVMTVSFIASSAYGQDWGPGIEDICPATTLLQSEGGVPAVYRDGKAIFPGKGQGIPGTQRDRRQSRSYLRTDGTDFSSLSFTAEVTVTIPSGSGPYSTAFLGLGVGEPYEDFWGEPRVGSHIYCRAAPNGFANGYFGVTDNAVENPKAVQPGAGDGTHRLRLNWDAESRTATFEIHRNYTGGPFVATSKLGPVSGEDSFDASNSSIFLGGAGDIAFEDLVIEPQLNVSLK